jgi:hypothetical protein
MTNGNIIGKLNTPTTAQASGVWSVREQIRAQRDSVWPKSYVSDGLLLHLDAADQTSYSGSGTTWFDLSGNNNNGTIQSGVSHTNSGLSSYFTFDGTSSGYVTLPLLSSSAINITMIALVNMPASDGGAIFYNGDSGGYGFGIGDSTFDNSGNNAIGLYQLVRWIDTNVNWGTGWMVAGLTLDASSTASFIKNNSVIATSSGTAPNTPVNNAAIGVDSPAGSRNFAGNIAWVGFYNRQLSQAELDKNYNYLISRFT